MEITSRYNLWQNIKQRRCIKWDVFSRLPDDVIISHILSRLMPREAGKCCLISRRWLSLWKQSVSCRLIFNSISGEVYRFSVPNIRKERQDFVSWINHFLDLLQHNKKINEFIVVKKCVFYPLEFPNFQSLEQLEVKMEMYNGLYLLWPTILINSAPALRTFAIELKHHAKKLRKAYLRHMEDDEQVKDLTIQADTLIVGRTPRLTPKVECGVKSASKQQHGCLKVVEIRHFVGNESDMMLARCLLRMPFLSLEKLVLVTSPDTLTEELEYGLIFQNRSRNRANLARRWLPSSTKLVIC